MSGKEVTKSFLKQRCEDGRETHLRNHHSMKSCLFYSKMLDKFSSTLRGINANNESRTTQSGILKQQTNKQRTQYRKYVRPPFKERLALETGWASRFARTWKSRESKLRKLFALHTIHVLTQAFMGSVSPTAQLRKTSKNKSLLATTWVLELATIYLVYIYFQLLPATGALNGINKGRHFRMWNNNDYYWQQ